MWVIILLMSILLLIGFISSKGVSSSTDFLVAGRNVPVGVLAFTIAATHFGGGALVGGIQQGAELGVWAGMYGIIGYAIASFVNAWIAPKFRTASNNMTPPDFVEYRYGYSKFMRSYHAIVYSLGTIAIIAAQFNALGGMASAFGISRETAIIVGGVVVAIYTALAGLKSVILADVFNFSICLLFLPIVAVMGMRMLDAQAGVQVSQIVGEPFFASSGAAGTFLYSLIPTVVGSMYAYEYYLRYQSAKSDRDATIASILGGVLLLIVALPIGITGAVAQQLYPHIPSGEVLGVLVSDALPKWASNLFLAVVIAAIMSTADSMMTSLSGMITRDLYHKVFNPDKDYNELKGSLALNRITCIVGAIIAMVIALRFTSIMGLLFWFSPLQSGVMFAPIIIGMFWKGANRTGAYTAVIVGALVALVDMLGIIVWPERMLVTMAAGAVALFIGSKLSKEETIMPTEKTPS